MFLNWQVDEQIQYSYIKECYPAKKKHITNQCINLCETLKCNGEQKKTDIRLNNIIPFVWNL